MKHLIIAVLFLSCIAHSQEGKSNKIPLKASFGFNFSPGFSSIIKNQDTFFGSKSYSGPGISLGFRTNLQFKKWIGFQTGLDIIGFGQYLDRDSVITPSGNPDPSIDHKYFKTHSHIYSIAIPLLVNFNIGEKKAKFHIGLGLLPSFGLFSHTVMKYWRPDGSVYTKGFVNTTSGLAFDLYSSLSAGLRYDANDRFTFLIEPIFKLGLIPIVNGSVSGIIYMRYMIGIDFTFLFGKGK